MKGLKKKNIITVVGAGYVGMSIAVMLSKKNKVLIHDIDSNRINKINNNVSPIADNDISLFLKEGKLDLTGTTDNSIAYIDANFVIVATPTNYDPKINKFDTTNVDQVVKNIIEANNKAIIVIKSTIPIGHTKSLKEKYKTNKIIFSPEFLQEGRALYDNLYPSRVVIGSLCENAKLLAKLIKESVYKKDTDIIFTGPDEAESIKLFANSYLAMRVCFFNELDSFAMIKGLDSKSIIDSVCLDERIGNIYNNPSFGYGGYCLPKDTKQLLNSFGKIPQSIITATVDSNIKRKNVIVDEIKNINPESIGIFRLTMKKDSDNFRSSSIKEIIEKLKQSGFKIYIYEPNLRSQDYLECKKIDSIEDFKSKSDLIVANRMDTILNDVKEKCFTRDIFGYN